ncbi:PASTA domain-containing protein [Pontibacillus yanchengensis]|uniref:serine-type D-Ala-D-Ala carboxypeptidase n=2 Tax=Pontibacillus yanchengensis TaxID=462910 RepID=A0A6I4ZYY7_9BACI|nr:penicillin-binding protein [Pontibacillus yanchengensis]MYL33043.1 PASTA domain-containing protein [Pontibacillus yanchengensis]MYL52107.1 PASTA domain-containing protein [Pontibacillus yanchengensis]
MKKNRTTHRMAKLFMMIFTILFVVLFGRFFYIQATGEIEGVNLEKWAEKKRTSSYTIDADRGKIVDRNGMTLAYDRPTYSIYAIVDQSYSKDSEEPLHVEDAANTAEKLAPVLDMQKQEIISQIKNGKSKDRFQVEFGAKGRYLSQDKKEKIKKMDLPGIQFTEQAKRYYPNGTFASHVLGFAQNKENSETIEGIMGIEKQMENQLQEEDGGISYQRDKYNMKLLNPEEVIKKPQDGATVKLTLDQKIQTFLEDAMNQVDENYSPSQMMAVVMDPKTGEVLALSNRPSFNPNSRKGIDNWYNDVIAYPYEPGSTMKIFTLAAAMDAGVYDGDEVYQSGSYQVDDKNRAIYDHNRDGWGPITYDEGIQRSSNVAAAKLLWEKLGPERFAEYYKDFGLTEKTGIDLPGEESGRLLYNYPIEKITTAFGQGSTVTPIQQMMAATSIANEGKMMKPYVISEVTDPSSGKVLQKTEPEMKGEPIDAATAKSVRGLLGEVVTGEHGTGKAYQLNGYSVAGKTGTAQIPDADSGGYMIGRENYIFSFLGMAPKEDPELMMYVSVKQPNLEPSELGTDPVSDIFNTVMENSLRYLNIQPDKNQDTTNVEANKLKDYVEKSASKAASELKEQGAHPIVLGNGDKVQKMLPKSDSSILKNERVFLLTNGTVEMPDMTGWSMRDALKLGSILELKMENIGNGYVYKQSVQEGSSISKGSYLVVELKPPNQDSSEADSSENQNERSMQQSNSDSREEEQ